jgi:hypothetical protein
MVGRSGLSVKKKLCEQCDFQDHCAYLAQERFQKSNAGLFLMTHDYAILDVCPAPHPDVVIIDESIVAKFTAHFSMPLADLEHATNLLPEHARIFRSVIGSLRSPASFSTLSSRAAEIRVASGAVHSRHQEMVEEALARGGSDAEMVREILQIESFGLSRVHRLLTQIGAEIEVGGRDEFNGVVFRPPMQVAVDGLLADSLLDNATLNEAISRYRMLPALPRTCAVTLLPMSPSLPFASVVSMV